MTRNQGSASYLRAATAAMALAALLLHCGAAAAAYRIELQAQPQRPRAGGEPCAITANISDALGAPARDGTQITFVTTLGAIAPQVAETSGGIARTELTSAAPGTAEVSILAEGQREVVVVEFTGAAAGPARPAAKPAPVVKIEGRYVAYSADYDCVTATDQARARAGALVIEAGNLQYEVAQGMLKAQHDVRLTNGGVSLEGERACYRVASCDGVLLRAREGVERVAFRADDLTAPAADPVGADNLQPVDTSDTNTWIVARDALIFPNERIQFTDATLYVGEKRIFSLPHYVAPLRGQRSLLNQVFSVSSYGGLNLDLPLYYAGDEHHLGSLHVRHRARDSYGYGGAGWSLGLEEQYRFSSASRGRFAVDDLAENTRSLRLDHQIEFGPRRRMDMGVSYYRYSPDYPGALTGRALYSQRLRGSDLSVMALGSSIAGMSSWSVDGQMRWDDRPLGKTGVDYDVTTNLGYGGAQYGYGGGLCLGGGIGLSPPAWEIAQGTTAALDLAQQLSWAQIGGPRTAFDARLMLRQSLGNLGGATVSYDYDLSRGGYYSSYGRQQLSVNAFLNQGLDWRASGYLTYSLDRDSLFASGNLSYSLPFEADARGRSPWRLDLRGSYAQFGAGKSVSSRVGLGRALGAYEVLVCYSPTASSGYGSYGYGYGRGKSFWIEFSPLGY